MLYRNLARLGVVLVCLLQACRKEYSKEDWIIETPVETVPPVAEKPETCTYSPYTVGSTFTYRYKAGAVDVPFTVTVSRDTIIKGDHYSILSSSNQEQYVSCKDGSYYLYETGINLPDYTANAGKREFLYDFKSLGDKWADTINIMNNGERQTGLIIYTLIKSSGPKTVLGKEYQDVLGVQQDAGLLIAGKSYVTNRIGTYYYAKGVGYIEADYPSDTTRLMSYSIIEANTVRKSE
jgi:hypothetical protein